MRTANRKKERKDKKWHFISCTMQRISMSFNLFWINCFLFTLASRRWRFSDKLRENNFSSFSFAFFCWTLLCIHFSCLIVCFCLLFFCSSFSAPLLIYYVLKFNFQSVQFDVLTLVVQFIFEKRNHFFPFFLFTVLDRGKVSIIRRPKRIWFK